MTTDGGGARSLSWASMKESRVPWRSAGSSSLLPAHATCPISLRAFPLPLLSCWWRLPPILEAENQVFTSPASQGP